MVFRTHQEYCPKILLLDYQFQNDISVHLGVDYNSYHAGQRIGGVFIMENISARDVNHAYQSSYTQLGRWFSSRSSCQCGTEMICYWHITMAQFFMMFPKVFPFNLGSGKTYSPKSFKGFQKEIHFGESMELAAILDAILNFEKKPRGWTTSTCQIVFVT